MLADVVLQTLLIIGMMVGLIIQNANPSSEAFVYPFFGFAIYQVVSSFVLGQKFDDRRRKAYTRLFLWTHVIGSLVVALFLLSEIELLVMIGCLILFIDWIILPLPMAIGCYINAWLAY